MSEPTSADPPDATDGHAPAPVAASDVGSSKNVRFVVGLDHLRGFAAFLVVLHHTYWTALGQFQPPMINWERWPRASSPLSAPFIEGHVAVAIFFVVSGFIFTLAGFGRHVAYGPYLRNRCLRVFPTFFVVLFFGLALYPARVDLTKIIMTATIFSDFPQKAIDLHPVSTAFWTVAVEVQFYLVFPFLIAIYSRQGRGPLLRLLALMVALRTVAYFIGAAHNPASPVASIRDVNYWHLVPGHLDQFLIGMLGAPLYMRWKGDPRADALGAPGFLSKAVVPWLRDRPAACAAFGLTTFLGYVFLLNQLGGYPDERSWKILQPTLEGIAAFSLILGYLAVAPRLSRGFDRVFTFMGDISFPTYIAHFMLVGLIIGDPLNPAGFPGMVVDFSSWVPGLSAHWNALANTLVLVVPATIVLAYLLHAGVEAPFMRLRRRYVSERPED